MQQLQEQQGSEPAPLVSVSSILHCLRQLQSHRSRTRPQAAYLQLGHNTVELSGPVLLSGGPGIAQHLPESCCVPGVPSMKAEVMNALHLLSPALHHGGCDEGGMQ